MNYMSIEEFREHGYLQEANRLFFHPLGLALTVNLDEETGEWSLDGVDDYRDDPEGYLFKDLSEEVDERKAENVLTQYERIAPERRRRYGWVIQPIGHKFDDDAG